MSYAGEYCMRGDSAMRADRERTVKDTVRSKVRVRADVDVRTAGAEIDASVEVDVGPDGDKIGRQDFADVVECDGFTYGFEFIQIYGHMAEVTEIVLAE